MIALFSLSDGSAFKKHPNKIEEETLYAQHK